MLSIVLIEPEIPQNTGNIVRTCAATGSRLYLVGKLGFSTDDKHLKRAGLDYWSEADIRYAGSFDELFEQNKDKRFYFATTKAQNCYSDIKFENDCFLVFGKETKGIDESLLEKNIENTIRIPMINDIRSLNLSNSVAVVLYEALRQQGFEQFTKFGKLKK